MMRSLHTKYFRVAYCRFVVVVVCYLFWENVSLLLQNREENVEPNVRSASRASSFVPPMLTTSDQLDIPLEVIVRVNWSLFVKTKIVNLSMARQRSPTCELPLSCRRTHGWLVSDWCTVRKVMYDSIWSQVS